METEAKFLNAAKRVLDWAEKNIDAGTVAHLRAARRQALEEGRRRPLHVRPTWLLPVGGLATAGIVLTVAGLLWFMAPNTPAPLQASMDDLELFTARDNPEFFADLDFFIWLDDNPDAS